MKRTIAEVVGGSIAGTLATVPMSVVMLASQAAGFMEKQPPEKITEELLDRARLHPPEPVKKELTVVNHLLFGAAAGALYGLARRALTASEAMPPARVEVPASIAFGLGVWFVSYEGWVPASGFMPPSHKTDPSRPLTMASAHVVFGACLALGMRWLKR